MSFRRLALVLAVCAGSFVVACGFTDVGALDVAAEGGAAPGSNGNDGGTTGADGSSTADGASTSDGSASTGVPVCNPATCALPSPPAGWELVLLGTSRADACPAGFDSADAIESPVAGADACACAACVKTGTKCSTGAIATKADNGGGACGTSATTLDANGGACQNLNTNFGTDALILAPAAVPGSCTSAASPVPAMVTSQPRRVCTRQPSTCVGGACGAPATMKACIGTTGDVACPSGTKHVVGGDVALTCPSCACSITSATCGGTFDFYGESGCAGAATTLTAGVCKFTNGAPIKSAKWNGVVASETCTVAPLAPTTTLTAPQTICCP
jgi:hypothetical protein